MRNFAMSFPRASGIFFQFRTMHLREELGIGMFETDSTDLVIAVSNKPI